MSKKNLSKDEVLHLAKLAGLHLTEEEIEKNSEQLSETIDYVKNLEELDTEGVKPTNSVVDLSNITFEDGKKNERQLSKEDAFSNVNNSKHSAFIVDRIMQE